MIRDSGSFKKTIVLLNTGNPMEVNWVEEYDVDAVLWIGCPGEKGFTGVANILIGNANPSGKLVDTYAVSSLSAPAVVNNTFNNQQWANLTEALQKSSSNASEISYYTVQTEGIYIGYKYYETRYEDQVLGRFNATVPQDPLMAVHGTMPRRFPTLRLWTELYHLRSEAGQRDGGR